ncbi:sensor domain-containing diguanylate cyclase [Modestobacter altitudinis]|uniref:sensor domain-containing diguanylate cyclase n=1 Tax=Modestobacter altitudinis TaxID=2213158 RepID=UPI00110D156D|nr:sensor domain-containing diguanylate cyclase [Modestobacter altitudinis]
MTRPSPHRAATTLRARQAQVVAGLRLSDLAAEAELGTIVRLAAALLGAPCATVNVLDTAEQCQLATHGFVGGPSPREESLCEQTRRLTEDVFASTDLLVDERFRANPWVDGRYGRVRGYVSAPLRVEQVVIGTLCVFDPEPHAFTPLDLQRLADLADVVVALLERDRQAQRAEALTAELARAHAFDRALLDALPVGVLAVDEQGRVQQFNQVCRDWHGPVRLGERLAPVGQTFGSLFAADGRTPLRPEDMPSARALGEGRVQDLEIVAAPPSGPARRLSVTGSAIRDSDGGLLGAVVALADVTRQRELEDRLRAEALHDPLTGLPNRGLLVDRVEHGLTTTARTGLPLAVLFCDLDGFKAVNDEHGHPAGDVVLQETARRLQTVLRPGDTVGRLGGDEFVAVCPGVPGEAAAAALAARIVAAVGAPVVVGRGPTGPVEVRVGVSVGVTLATGADVAGAVLARADEAMYRVKRERRSGVR